MAFYRCESSGGTTFAQKCYSGRNSITIDCKIGDIFLIAPYDGSGTMPSVSSGGVTYTCNNFTEMSETYDYKAHYNYWKIAVATSTSITFTFGTNGAMCIFKIT